LSFEAVRVDEYKQFIQLLSKRELEVAEAVLAGNFSYKELSYTLNISVNTVKTHFKNIYQTTSVSNVSALLSLFQGFTNNHPLITQKGDINPHPARYIIHMNKSKINSA
jgi:DNA-binding CsgD family transcriptional regulator